MDTGELTNSQRCKRWRENKKRLDPDYFRRTNRERRMRNRIVPYQIGQGIDVAEADNSLDSSTQDCSLPSTRYDDGELTTDLDYVVFQHPFSLILSGPSNSGKTWIVARLLQWRHLMIKPNIDEILWYHGQKQDFHDTLRFEHPGIRIIQGKPDSNDINEKINTLVVIDDLMDSMDTAMSQLFSKKSHHCNISVIFISQNLFVHTSGNRTSNISGQYNLIMKCVRDKVQIRTLQSQMDIKNDFLKRVYNHATSDPHGYLLVCCDKYTDNFLRFRKNIFPDDEDNLVYVKTDINNQPIPYDK